jgi:hypothetical protein
MGASENTRTVAMVVKRPLKVSSVKRNEAMADRSRGG